MSQMKENIASDLKDAMRAKEKEKIETLRFIMAAIKQYEIDNRVEIDDKNVITILQKLAKQRREGIEQFQKANRDDLVAKETQELELITHYLPQPLSDETIEKHIDETIEEIGANSVSDMGKVMALLKSKLHGRADMSTISAKVKEKLL